MSAAGPEKDRDGGQGSSTAWKWMNFLFGGVGIVLIPWMWGAASRSPEGWSWGFLAAAAGILTSYLLLGGRRPAQLSERAAVSLGVACAAIGIFVGLAQLRDGNETRGGPQSSLPVSPTSAASTPRMASPTTPSDPEQWAPVDPADVVHGPKKAIVDCPALHRWDGPKRIVVDRVEMEDGFDIGGSCGGGVWAEASFPFEEDVTRFRVTAGILKDSADPARFECASS